MYICSGMYHLSFCRKRAAEQKIKNYFFQLTDGCGSHECKNEFCASSGRKQTSKDDAAALALQLFMKKARLCEPLQDKNHKGMIIQWFCKILRFSRKFKTCFIINLVLTELKKPHKLILESTVVHTLTMKPLIVKQIKLNYDVYYVQIKMKGNFGGCPYCGCSLYNIGNRK